MANIAGVIVIRSCSLPKRINPAHQTPAPASPGETLKLEAQTNSDLSNRSPDRFAVTTVFLFSVLTCRALLRYVEKSRKPYEVIHRDRLNNEP